MTNVKLTERLLVVDNGTHLGGIVPVRNSDEEKLKFVPRPSLANGGLSEEQEVQVSFIVDELNRNWKP